MNISNSNDEPNLIDHADDRDAERVKHILAFTLEVVIIISIGTVGLIGNVSTVYMFSRKRRSISTFHKLMIMLAVYDTMYIVLCILLFSVPAMCEEYKTGGLHFYVAPKAIPFIQIALTGSVYSTMAILVERYLKVCKPFYAFSRKCTGRYYIFSITIFKKTHPHSS